MVLQYARHGAARYISHLDMQRAFSRALRRARLPVAYSQGFNPHIILSFASPLSVGYATDADYLEAEVADGYDAPRAADALNAVLPADIRVRRAFAPLRTKKKLMALNHSAAYAIRFALENESEYVTIKKALEAIRDAEACLTEDRKGRTMDIAPLLIEAACTDDRIDAVLMNSAAGALNPAMLARAVLRKAGIDRPYTVERKECYALADGRVVPFCALE
jgi:radical SAM-linked protein